MVNKLSVGQYFESKRIFRQSDFDRFATLSGDDNPIHVDPEFSTRTKFGKTVAHGMLLYSTVSSVLGTALPGVGMLQQELMFPNPVFVGDEITIQAKVLETMLDLGLVRLETVVLRSDGETGLQGKTLVQVSEQSSWTSLPIEEPSRAADDEQAPFKGLEIGQKAENKRVFSASDLADYAALTQDNNPLYSDVAYAQDRGFKTALIPGSLIAGLFSHLLGTRLPGQGTNYLKQRLQFLQPAYLDDCLTASVEVSRIRASKAIVNLITRCTNATGEHVCIGEALVMVSDIQAQ